MPAGAGARRCCVMRFSDEQMRRYSRQILLREVGGRGQARLLQAELAVVCAGAAGRVAAQYLLRAGVTHLSVWAHDAAQLERARIELSADGLDPARVQPMAEAPAAVRQAAAPAPAADWVLIAQVPENAADPAGAAVFFGLCAGEFGAIGRDAAALAQVLAQAPDSASVSGDASAAMATGAGLALQALQHVLGLPALYPNPWLVSGVA